MLTELLYPFQDGDTPFRLALREGSSISLELLLSKPGIDVNFKGIVSWLYKC